MSVGNMIRAIARSIAAIRLEYESGREMINRVLWVSADGLTFEDTPSRHDT